MKRATRASRRRRASFQSDVFTLSDAKTYLGRLTEKAGKGQPVVRGQDRFLLQHVPSIDPIPIRPRDYFANCYSQAEIAEDNRLAKAAVI